MIEIGDILYCDHNDIGIVNVSVNKTYEIIEVCMDNSYGRISINDDRNGIISFTINIDKNNLSYRNWFHIIDIKEYRKKKLLEIEHNI